MIEGMSFGQQLTLGIIVVVMIVSAAVLIPDFLRWLKERKTLNEEAKRHDRRR